MLSSAVALAIILTVIYFSYSHWPDKTTAKARAIPWQAYLRGSSLSLRACLRFFRPIRRRTNTFALGQSWTVKLRATTPTTLIRSMTF